LAAFAGIKPLEVQTQLVMNRSTQGWVILKCKSVGDFGAQNDTSDEFFRTD
jgi:hypothetical protein